MKTFRCAVYTRKSSEENLDREFNSLAAQREACEAYITSQRAEGWKLVRKRYDDGGFSGGTLERPGLKALLEDVRCGQVNVVVVYKVDRLTRSLTDFAKIVDVFDTAGASFVAVTQHFNTTTSMGRLTLNVLLSFAQFEREVTGERIRDKIAASKRKGMWMGGRPPLGYDVKGRKLVVNKAEARAVRLVFERYRELGSVTQLRDDLRQRGVRSKRWVSASGKHYGGNVICHGALYRILQNRLYLGQVEHRGHAYTGEHKAIVPRELWDAVQEKLDANRRRRNRTDRNREPYPLAGVVFDDRGHVMSPTYSQKGEHRRYRYYVSAPLLRKERRKAGTVSRVPAQLLEDLVFDRVGPYFDHEPDNATPRNAVADRIDRVTVRKGTVEIVFMRPEGFREGEVGLYDGDEIADLEDKLLLRVRAVVKRRGGEKIVAGPKGEAVIGPGAPNAELVRNVARAYRWREDFEAGRVRSYEEVARAEACTERFVRKILPLAYLAPDIVEAILGGTQPVTLELQHLTNGKLPLEWAAQRKQLGFSN